MTDFLNISDTIDEKREFNDKVEKDTQGIRQDLTKIALKLQKQGYFNCDEQLETIKNKLDTLFTEVGDTKKIFHIDSLAEAFTCVELFVFYLKHAKYAQETEGQTSLLLKPFKQRSLTWTTGETWVAAVCQLTSFLGEMALTEAINKNGAPVKQIFDLISEIWEALQNHLKIKRNCPLRKHMDPVKWRKRDVQKLCYDLMLIEEAPENNDNNAGSQNGDN